MSKKLFEESSDEDDKNKDKLTINKSYAENYNTWRRKEEYQILKDRYGDEEADSETTSEEEGPEPDNPEFDMDFFRVLAAVRLKHPVLQEDRKFFKKSYESSPSKTKKGTKPENAPLTIRDHEMKLVLQNGCNTEDDNEPGSSNKRVIDDDNCDRLMDQKRKSSFKFDDELSGEESDDGLFTKKESAPQHNQSNDDKENPAIDFLKGKRQKLDNEVDEQLLKGLQKEWQTNMSEKDKYLMDFFVNQRYLEKEDEDESEKPGRNFLLDFEPLDEDERTYDKMVEYETKYRFRFEEPGEEFVKKYPRMIKDTVRKEDTRRREVRDRKKERMDTEKERRKQEIQRMKALRKKEVMERIKILQDAAGGGYDAPDFQNVDLDADFDPDAHDAAMANMFNEDYYQNYDEKTAEKPEDEELNKELEEEYAKLKELDYMPEETFGYVEVCPNNYGLTTEEILYAKDTELNQWYTMKKLMRQGKDQNFERKESVNFAKRAQREDIKRKILPSLFIDNFEDNWKADEERKRKRNLKKKERRQKKKALEEGLTTTIEESTTKTEQTPEPKAENGHKVEGKSKRARKKKKVTNENEEVTKEIQSNPETQETKVTKKEDNKYTDKTNKYTDKTKGTKVTKKKECSDAVEKSLNVQAKNKEETYNGTNNIQSKIEETYNGTINIQSKIEENEVQNNKGSAKKKRKRKHNTDAVNGVKTADSKMETNMDTEDIISKIEGYEERCNSETNNEKKRKRDNETNGDIKKQKRTKIGNELLGLSDARIAAYGENPKKVKKLLKYSKTFSV